MVCHIISQKYPKDEVPNNIGIWHAKWYLDSGESHKPLNISNLMVNSYLRI